MKNSTKLLLALFLGLPLLGAVFFIVNGIILYSKNAHTIEDLGKRIELNKQLPPFDKLEVNGAWDITVQQGAQYQVSAEIYEGLESELELKVEDGTLHLALKEGAPLGFSSMGRKNEKLKTLITLPELSAISNKGLGNIEIKDFKGETLNIRNEGVGFFSATDCEYENLIASLKGVGTTSLGGLLARNIDLDSKGVGNVIVKINGGALKIRSSGVGSVTYYGPSSMRDIVKEGIGSVKEG